MKRWLAAAACCLIVGLTQAIVLGTLAQAEAPAPGSGHGFLIDKHVVAGVTCAKCHTKNTATPPDTPTCLSCHGGTYAKLGATTKSEPNPHASHQGEIPCAQCHNVHKASVTVCNQCHTFDMKAP